MPILPKTVPQVQNRQLQTQPNPNAALADGVSPGFQRQVMADAQLTRRQFLRATLQGTTSSYVITDPIIRMGLQAFRNDAITCCLEMAAINRTSSAPVLIQMPTFQANTVKMSAQGSTTNNGHDTVLGCVTPNQGNMYMPHAGSSGAQFQLSNILNNPMTIGITDLTNTPITDLQSWYLSFVFFEREPAPN